MLRLDLFAPGDRLRLELNPAHSVSLIKEYVVKPLD